jgi:hypothetical protein
LPPGCASLAIKPKPIGSASSGQTIGEHDAGLEQEQFCRQRTRPIDAAVGKTVGDVEITPLDVVELVQAAQEAADLA